MSSLPAYEITCFIYHLTLLCHELHVNVKIYEIREGFDLISFMKYYVKTRIAKFMLKSESTFFLKHNYLTIISPSHTYGLEG